jgi:hypothetical protein
VTENAKIVFESLCKYSQNWYGVNVITTKSLTEALKISRYKVIKAVHELIDEGLVKKGYYGRPAVMSYGEVAELAFEAEPPICGWSVTEKGQDTAVYKKACEEYEQSLQDWAEGKYD